LEISLSMISKDDFFVLHLKSLGLVANDFTRS